MSKTEDFDEQCYVSTLEILKLLEEMNERIEKIENNTKPKYTNHILIKMHHMRIRKKAYFTILNNKEILQPKQTTLLLQN